jgi:hypothetical protein
MGTTVVFDPGPYLARPDSQGRWPEEVSRPPERLKFRGSPDCVSKFVWSGGFGVAHGRLGLARLLTDIDSVRAVMSAIGWNFLAEARSSNEVEDCLPSSR